MEIIQKIKKFFHDKLGWGFPIKNVWSGKFQSTCSCEFCNNELTQDSTGAWFHLSN